VLRVSDFTLVYNALFIFFSGEYTKTRSDDSVSSVATGEFLCPCLEDHGIFSLQRLGYVVLPSCSVTCVTAIIYMSICFD